MATTTAIPTYRAEDMITGPCDAGCDGRGCIDCEFTGRELYVPCPSCNGTHRVERISGAITHCDDCDAGYVPLRLVSGPFTA